MKVYNKEKTQILENYNLELGYLDNDTIVINEPEIKEVKEVGHYEVVKEYENGGKDLEWIIDVEGVEYRPAKTYDENILVYVEYTKEELEEIELNKLREQREFECFPIINRGKLWYDTLTEEQVIELNKWYQSWLNVTETKFIPTKPSWLK